MKKIKKPSQIDVNNEKNSKEKNAHVGGAKIHPSEAFGLYYDSNSKEKIEVLGNKNHEVSKTTYPQEDQGCDFYSPEKNKKDKRLPKNLVKDESPTTLQTFDEVNINQQEKKRKKEKEKRRSSRRGSIRSTSRRKKENFFSPELKRPNENHESDRQEPFT